MLDLPLMDKSNSRVTKGHLNYLNSRGVFMSSSSSHGG